MFWKKKKKEPPVEFYYPAVSTRQWGSTSEQIQGLREALRFVCDCCKKHYEVEDLAYEKYEPHIQQICKDCFQVGIKDW